MAKFTLPKAFISQLKEFSNGGFCLFVVNPEGNIDVFFEVENEVNALGLISKMQNIGQALETAIRANDIRNASGNDEEDENF